jgi:hypothetical protein
MVLSRTIWDNASVGMRKAVKERVRDRRIQAFGKSGGR